MQLPETMKVVYVPTADLKPTDYNPRGMTDEEKKHLTESITNFQFAEPIVVNSAENRFNVVIGGHQRLTIAKELGIEKIPCVYMNIPEIEKEKELNLRLNRNQGHWEWDKLMADFPKEMLMGVGFTEMEIGDWKPETKSIEETPENLTGLMSLVKVKCPAHIKDMVIEKIQNAIDGMEEVEIVA